MQNSRHRIRDIDVIRLQPGGTKRQIVPRSATVRSKMPPPCRVMTDLLPRIATQISVSGCVFFHAITPLLWVRSCADRPDQPRSAEEASTPVEPFLDTGPMYRNWCDPKRRAVSFEIRRLHQLLHGHGELLS